MIVKKHQVNHRLCIWMLLSSTVNAISMGEHMVGHCEEFQRTVQPRGATRSACLFPGFAGGIFSSVVAVVLFSLSHGAVSPNIRDGIPKFMPIVEAMRGEVAMNQTIMLKTVLKQHPPKQTNKRDIRDI